MKIIDKFKKFNPSLKICYLYFFLPIIALGSISVFKEGDIWFLIKHGEYVINHGFPHTDFLSMHNGLHFVMQQWFSSVIFYITYHFLGSIGLKLLLQITNILFMFILYKLCLLISKNRYRLSIFMTVIIDIFILLFTLPRPWIFTFLIILLELYILEMFYRNNKKKLLLLLPVLSLIQINIQASMWLMLIIIMLPYIASLIIEKDKKVYYLLLIIPLMIFIGFLNPYGIENMLYVFNSYNKKEINYVVAEMHPPTIRFGKGGIIGNFLFTIVFSISMIYILAKKGKVKIRYILLTTGTLILALINIRSIPLFIVCGIFPLADYLTPYFKKEKQKENNVKNYNIALIFLVLYSATITLFVNNKVTSDVKEGIDIIIKDGGTSKDDIYIKYDYGSYAEYKGLKPYVDTRAEVFIKSINHKEYIFLEYASLIKGTYDYNKFINKYNFKYMLIYKDELLYDDVLKDEKYTIIYDNKEYSVFSVKNKE